MFECFSSFTRLPPEVRVAVFGREPLDVLFGADAPHLAAEVHGHVVLRSVAVLKWGRWMGDNINFPQIVPGFAICRAKKSRQSSSLTNRSKLLLRVSINKKRFTIHIRLASTKPCSRPPRRLGSNIPYRPVKIQASQILAWQRGGKVERRREGAHSVIEQSAGKRISFTWKLRAHYYCVVTY